MTGRVSKGIEVDVTVDKSEESVCALGNAVALVHYKLMMTGKVVGSTVAAGDGSVTPFQSVKEVAVSDANVRDLVEPIEVKVALRFANIHLRQS